MALRRKRFDATTEREIAAQAGCDPRSVRKYMAGGTFASLLVPRRIADALKQRGVADPNKEAK